MACHHSFQYECFGSEILCDGLPSHLVWSAIPMSPSMRNWLSLTICPRHQIHDTKYCELFLPLILNVTLPNFLKSLQNCYKSCIYIKFSNILINFDYVTNSDQNIFSQIMTNLFLMNFQKAIMIVQSTQAFFTTCFHQIQYVLFLKTKWKLFRHKILHMICFSW